MDPIIQIGLDVWKIAEVGYEAFSPGISLTIAIPASNPPTVPDAVWINKPKIQNVDHKIPR